LGSQIKELYFCEHHQVQNLAADLPPEIEALLEKMIRNIYRNGMPATIDKKVTLHYANELWKGIVEGFGSDIPDVDFDTPDYTMLRHLQENVFQFSAAKNYQQLKALSQALTDGDKVRTFSEFRTIAHSINNEHVNQWLKAEYDMAIGSSQAARMWTDFEANAEAMPLLEFDAIMDGHTTEICASLNGIVRPLNDHFWDIYYIPNHWGERSTIRQLSSGENNSHGKSGNT
jgi:aspartyl-tRNA synthetase